MNDIEVALINSGEGVMIQWFLIGLSVLLFVAGYTLFESDKTAGGGLFLTAALVVLAFAFLAKFKRFKGLGFEGELWEQKMDEAARLIDRLRNFSLSSFKPVVSLMAHAGLMSDGMSRTERHEWSEGMISLLTGYGATKEAINETMRPLNDRIELEMSTVIGDAILACCKKNSEDLDQEVSRLKGIESRTEAEQASLSQARLARDSITTLRDRVRKVGNPENFSHRSALLDELIAQAVKPDQRDAFVARLGTRIKELKYFEKHRTHFDPAIWISRDWDSERQRAATMFDENIQHFNL